MEDQHKKELIAIIKEQLKAADERPYREGAWEAYKATYETKSVKKILSPYWAAAAALALAGFAAIFLYRNIDTEAVKIAQKPATERTISDSAPSTDAEQQRDSDELQTDALTPALPSFESVQAWSAITTDKESSEGHSTTLAAVLAPQAFQLANGLSVIQKETLSPKIFDIATPVITAEEETFASSDLGPAFSMAQQANPHLAQQQEAGKDMTPKRFKIANKFELGAFLSPTTTDQGFDVGGGLMLAYKLSNKLALRTGAAFNQYEVGMLASEMGPGLANGVSDYPAEPMNMVSKDVPYRAANLLLPNLNAVSGKVQTLDIPLELKYSMGKQFYATGGVSYAVVLSQERFNHFTEFTDAATFSSASDSGQPTTPASSPVETSSKSAENNINPNGFGGFMNFSIGRKTKLTRFMNISVEPYIKIPVGQFRRADMDYTNGGLRVITNF